MHDVATSDIYSLGGAQPGWVWGEAQEDAVPTPWEAGKLPLHFIVMETNTQNSTRSRPLLPVQEQSYHQQWSNLMVPSLFPGFAPYSNAPCLFSFSPSSWHFRLEKEITAWPSAHGKAAVLGHLIYLIPFKGKLTSFNKSHLMCPRKVGRGSFQTW